MRDLMKRFIVVGMLIDVVLVMVLLILKRRLPSAGGEFSDQLGLAIILEGRELRSRAQSFRGGSVLTIAGGTTLDLRSAKLAPEGAELCVHTWMGGTMILVPESWPVEVRGRAVMGGISNQTPGAGEGSDEGSAGVDGPRLVIEALAVWGGIEVGHRERSDVETARADAKRLNTRWSAPVSGTGSRSGDAGARVPI